jgi:hypothetical protein
MMLSYFTAEAGPDTSTTIVVDVLKQVVVIVIIKFSIAYLTDYQRYIK